MIDIDKTEYIFNKMAEWYSIYSYKNQFPQNNNKSWDSNPAGFCDLANIYLGILLQDESLLTK